MLIHYSQHRYHKQDVLFYLQISFSPYNPLAEAHSFSTNLPRIFCHIKIIPYLCTAKSAPVAKLVDAPDLGSGVSRRVGSSPIGRTHTICSLDAAICRLSCKLMNISWLVFSLSERTDCPADFFCAFFGINLLLICFKFAFKFAF